MRRSILNIAAVAGLVVAMALPSSPALGAATRPDAGTGIASAPDADCGGAPEKAWAQISGFIRTIYYTNCRDVTVPRRAYVYDLVPNYLPCKSVPPGATVSWTTSFFPLGWGIATC